MAATPMTWGIARLRRPLEYHYYVALTVAVTVTVTVTATVTVTVTMIVTAPS